MKIILLTILFSASVMGQGEGSIVIEGPTSVQVFAAETPGGTIKSTYVYAVYGTPGSTVKSLQIIGYNCGPFGPCKPKSVTDTQNWGPVKLEVQKFKNKYKGDADPNVDYGLGSLDLKRLQSFKSVSASTAPLNPQLVVLEAKSDARLLLYDLTTFATTNPVTLPNGARLFGVRPSQTGAGREVWTAHAGIGNQITITDLNTAQIVAAFPTKLDENATPVNIAFTNSGKTVYYVLRYLNPDASGNLGALLTYDAGTRALQSTLPLSIRPSSFLMAPDGLTAYIVGDSKILYYDVLSGTADLTASYPGAIYPQFIHPDGNRIFALQSGTPVAGVFPYVISVFDLAQRKIVRMFPIKFAAGTPAVMKLGQDGHFLTVLSNKDEVLNIDTQSGQTTFSFATNPGTFDLLTTPVLQ